MADNGKIFNAVIVPNGADAASLHFSLCVELNPSYRKIDTDPAGWCAEVALYQVKYFDLLPSAIMYGAKVDSVHIKKAAIDKATFPSRTERSASLWEQCMEVHLSGVPRSQDALSGPRARTVIPVVTSPTVEQVLSVAPHATGTLREMVPSMLSASIKGTCQGLPLSVLGQVGLQADERTRKIRERTVGYLVQDQRARAMSRRSRGEALPTNETEFGRDHRQVKEYLSALTGRMAATPDYVLRAFNALNASPNLRRLFGTTIDFTVPYAVPLDTTMAIAIDDVAFNEYFACYQTFVTARNIGGKIVLLGEDPPKYNAFVYDSVFQLSSNGKPKCAVVAFDPQGAASSIAAASQYLARVPDQALSPSADAHAETDGNRSSETSADNATFAHLRRLHAQASDTQTRGHTLYLTTADRYEPPAPPSLTPSTAPPPAQVRAPDLVRGYVIYVRERPAAPWFPLTTLTEELAWAHGNHDPKDSGSCEIPLGIHVGGGVVNSDGNVIDDGFLFSWDGTCLSTRNPMTHAEGEPGQTGRGSLRRAFDNLMNSATQNEPEVVALQQRLGKLFGIKHFPFNPRPRRRPELELRRSPLSAKKNVVKLRFGADRKFEYLLVAQYHNGYVPITADVLAGCDPSALPQSIVGGISPATTFERHEHVREIVVALQSDIYADSERKVLKDEHAGESPRDLVVRSGDLLSNDSSLRLILPPPVPTFQTYLWYDSGDLKDQSENSPNGQAPRTPRLDRRLGEYDLAKWYGRYSCEARNKEEFNANIERAREKNAALGQDIFPVRGCGRACGSYCGGTTQPTAPNSRTAYLPDPEVTGIYVEFFLDKECLHPAPPFTAKACPYRSGDYPNWKPWRFELRKRSADLEPGDAVSIDHASQTLSVELFEGQQCFARVTPMIGVDHGTMTKALLSARNLQFQAESSEAPFQVDYLKTSSTVVSLTHATQKPIIEPEIRGAYIRRFHRVAAPTSERLQVGTPATFEAEIDLCCELLNFREQGAPQSVASTGNIELYALWDDFNDHTTGPAKSIAQKRDKSSPTGGFVRVGQIPPGATLSLDKAHKCERPHQSGNPSANYSIPITITSEAAAFHITHHTDIVFKIRNTSKFASFFQNSSAASVPDAEAYARWSPEFTLSAGNGRVFPNAADGAVTATFMPNNVKPTAPQVEKIVALAVREDKRGAAAFFGNRVRIYLQRDHRQQTGAGERVGILIDEPAGIYKDGLAPFISEMGIDAVTDDVTSPSSGTGAGSHMSRADFVDDEAEYTPEDRRFRLAYDGDETSGAHPIGLVSYLPQFDPGQGLWYVDVRIGEDSPERQRHNRFIRLGLVTYQPHSGDYNGRQGATSNPSAAAPASPLDLDLRLSEPHLTDFFSVYPSRSVENPFLLYQSGTSEAAVFSGGVSSLFVQRAGNEKKLRSQFILTVERRAADGLWTPIDSTLAQRTVVVGTDTIQRPDDESRKHHLLLPESAESALISGAGNLFECHVRPTYKSGLFSGETRTIVREVEWFPNDLAVTWSRVEGDLASLEPSQIYGLRIKQVMVFRAGEVSRR